MLQDNSKNIILMRGDTMSDERNVFKLAREIAGLSQNKVMDDLQMKIAPRRIRELESGNTTPNIEDIIIMENHYGNNVIANYYLDYLRGGLEIKKSPMKKKKSSPLEKYLILRDPTMSVMEFTIVFDISKPTAEERVKTVREHMEKNKIKPITAGGLLTKSVIAVYGVSKDDYKDRPEVQAFLERERNDGKI